VTAWVALTSCRRGTAGDTVLTQRSGGISVFALQFARVLGARVIATTSTAEKAERLKALGASEVVNYAETPDWDQKARELTDGRGVDCVVEIGGPGAIAKASRRPKISIRPATSPVASDRRHAPQPHVGVKEVVLFVPQHSGQRLMHHIGRVFADIPVQDPTETAGAMKVADGFEPGAVIGPLIDMKVVEKVETHIADAPGSDPKGLAFGARGKTEPSRT
jgi:acyl-CoA reductase-like NAD-dependent aldehyde dehydrogenase